MAESMSVEELERKIAELTVSEKPDANVEISNLLHNLGSTYLLNNCFDKAVETYRKAVTMRPDCPDVYYQLANALIYVKPSEAAESYLTALELRPNDSPSLQNLAMIRYGQENFGEAERLCHKAIETSTTEKCLIAHSLLGKITYARGDFEASERHFAETRRRGVAAQIDLMLTLDIERQKMLEPVKSAQKALTPLQFENEKICKSIKSCRDELRWNPTDAKVIGQLNTCLQICCDWSDFDNRMKKLSDLIDDLLRNKLDPPVDRHSAVNMFPLSLQQQLAIATHFSNRTIKKSLVEPIQYRLSVGEKLRIGYVVTGHVTFPLVGDRSKINSDRFEVFYYCYFADPHQQQTVVGDWNDHLIDLSTFGDNSEGAAKRIASDGIQILINLDNGYMISQVDNASPILSHRPAPIQAVYRTDIGSTGATYMDYFISDKVASPLQLSYGYSEKLAYMPNGMFACDNRELLIKPQENLKEKEELRRRFHLPETAIVFGVNSNRSCQIIPEMFECWCEIVRRVPCSVLWFSIPYMEETISNLKKEAKKHRVNPRRLIFSDESIMDVPAYLLRTDYLVDIIITTPMRNGALVTLPMCRRVPIVTLPRESFPSRLAASLLTSIGCEELIAKSKWHYVEMAVNMGNKPELLQQMKDRMWENLPNSKLFKIHRYFVDLEILYDKMWKLKEMGKNPEHIV